MVGRTEGEVTLADLNALVPPANTRSVKIFGDIHVTRRWLAEQS